MKENLKRVFFTEKKCEYHKNRLSIICTIILLFCFAGFVEMTAKENRIEDLQNTSQTRTIKGIVVDNTGETLIGVSVSVKGTSLGTITDINGAFSLNVPSNTEELLISYIGYTPQTVKIRNQTDIRVQLETDQKVLDEIVVIGYGAVKRRDLTGAISSVKNEDIVLNPGSNPLQALQGKVPGLDITKESGQAGAGVKMQIRGTRSFSTNEDPAASSAQYSSDNPLFIIDGMPGDYSTLNPNDIESIEVLKDASSTAIYGSDGANGVIIITTKNGKAGKIKVDFNAFFGVNGWSTVPEMRMGESYIQGLRDANKATGNWSSTADDEKLFSSPEAYQAHLAGKYIDWPKALLKNNLTQNYSVAVSGGTDRTTAYFSLNFANEQGQYQDDDYKVYSSKIRVDHSVNKWLRTGVNLQASYVHRNKSYSRLINLMRATPVGELYDENGDLNKNPVVDDMNTVNMLLNNKSNYRNQDQNFKLYINPYIEITPMKGLTLTSRVGGTLNYSRNNRFQGQGSFNYYNDSGSSSVGPNSSVIARVTDKRNYNYKWENILTYNFNINKDHDFTFTGVTSWEHGRFDYTYLTQDNIADNKYLWHNIKGADSRGDTSYSMIKKSAYIGRMNYSYKGKYLFAASIRRDGDSRLADGNRWNTFPGISAAWRVSDETFMENTRSWLDDLKLRVGYGETGAAKIDPYTSSANLVQKNYTLGGESLLAYLFSQNYSNPNLTWEKSKNTNVGLDLTALNSRINLSADFYVTKTDGVIWRRNLPVINGAYDASTYYYMNMNICETKNTGLELSLNTRNIDTRDFKWNSSVTFAWNKEKILSLTDGISDNITNGDYALSIGHAVNSFYQYKKTGIWQKNEEADAAVFGLKPGDIKIDIPDMYKESDGVWYKIDETTGEKVYYGADNLYTISANDRQIIGKNSPDWSLGFQNSFYWKNFDLSIYMYARWGQMIDYEMLGFYDPQGIYNFPTYFDYWTEDNPSNDFPAIDSSRAITNYTASSSLNYVDGSFFKIKNITLGYTLPASIAKKAGLEKCRIYGTITNPYLYAKSHLLKDYDPEMNGDLDYPLTKQLVFGVNITF